MRDCEFHSSVIKIHFLDLEYFVSFRSNHFGERFHSTSAYMSNMLEMLAGHEQLQKAKSEHLDDDLQKNSNEKVINERMNSMEGLMRRSCNNNVGAHFHHVRQANCGKSLLP